MEDEDQFEEERKCLGGQFIQSNNQILFKVDTQEHSSFWDSIQTRFNRAGDMAILQTMEETYQFILDPENPLFLKYSTIPYLKGKRAYCLPRSDGDLLFCERDHKQSYL